MLSLATLFGVSMPVVLARPHADHGLRGPLGWLPAAGSEGLASLILPSLTLAAFSVALIARMTRGDHAGGAGPGVRPHGPRQGPRRDAWSWRATRCATRCVPILTVIGLQFGDAARRRRADRDRSSAGRESGCCWSTRSSRATSPMVQGIVLVFSTLFILTNLVVDLLYVAIDPRNPLRLRASWSRRRRGGRPALRRLPRELAALPPPPDRDGGADPAGRAPGPRSRRAASHLVQSGAPEPVAGAPAHLVGAPARDRPSRARHPRPGSSTAAGSPS